MAPSAVITPFVDYANDKMNLRYSHVVDGRYETWNEIAGRVVSHVVQQNKQVQYYVASTMAGHIYEAIRERKFIPGGRILSQAGRPYHQTDNCFCLRAVDTREGWAELAHKCTLMFMSGGGVGVDYTNVRPYGARLKRSGGIASGPLPLIEMVNSIAAAARAGGERRGACYASLPWNHKDVYDCDDSFIYAKVNPTRLQHTNISTMFNNQWLNAYQQNDEDAILAFDQTLYAACKYGDPGFQFDFDNQTLRNACTEIISADDSDSCCIGSINMAAIKDLDELEDVISLAILFLLCNTLYTEFPTPQVQKVKEENRRLGLGLMGIGEWFIKRNQPYGYVDNKVDTNPQAHSNGFQNWLQVYKEESTRAASYWANQLSINTPVATRAVAPTGTISIVGGHTTPGIEPVFHTCYHRTSNTLKTRDHNNGYKTETVVDPIVSKWMQLGYDVRDIDTAYTLSQSVDGIERRLAFQAFVQAYVDNGISSTVNLPPYQDGIEDTIAPILLKYLPELRGVTFYPDGRHDNQPVIPVDIADVDIDNLHMQEYEQCKGGECGI